ncbi:acyltransferase [Desulfobacula sp.]|uniref:acyltransferase n=1 Tax=Desulfobacula sp. TaxID=2593537 RepID=UPI0025BBE89E|nr:acyltransferase [Desulfobacula sp.]MBC2703248.1 N-acetyltransferase [Desulfobacula sp.]
MEKYFVHTTSYVDEGAKIGQGTKIWHFSHILSGALVGSNCTLGQNVCISGDVIIGNNVKIQNNVSVYDGVCIEDDVFLGPSCVLTNVTNPRAEISRKNLYEKTLIKRGSTIGANATIVCGVTIGRYAFVAAGAVVTGDVPDYTMVQGVPARQTGWISRHGHKLEKKDSNKFYICPESGLKYREIAEKRLICVDIEENQSLSKNMKTGKMDYKYYKKLKKV